MQTKIKTRSQNSCCMGRHGDKSGPRPTVRNQAVVEKCASGTKISKDSLKGHQNCVKASSRPTETSKSSNENDLKTEN